MTTPITNSLLITGTDTEVGKTIVTTALAAYWLKHHPKNSLGLIKPVQSGQGDFEQYTRLFDLAQTPETIAPQRFVAPLAPPLAAAQEGKTVDLEPVWQALSQLMHEREWVLIEALGGLGSPVTEEWTVADLAAAWRLPIVLVVPVKLGAIAQSVANVALARQYKLSVKGIILNCNQPLTAEQQENWTPIPLIERLTQLPVLGCMPYLSDPNNVDDLATAASQLALEALGDAFLI
ncbi:MAG: ATP-dependent dethiobiotin synthetase BioD [Leptolyngbya sp. SIO1D8]|nr:ATP-dependent dethiobiotin synthetase BioD [Leptolyngbya sp. SIO1D8]